MLRRSTKPQTPVQEDATLFCFEVTVNRFQDPAKRYSGVLTSTRKYVKYHGGFEELFDLTADPHELNNEARNPTYGSDLAALRELQESLRACAGDSCWAQSPP